MDKKLDSRALFQLIAQDENCEYEDDLSGPILGGRRRKHITAVHVHKPHVVIATVVRNSAGVYSLSESRCQILEMHDRSSPAIRRFQAQVGTLFERWGTDYVIMRVSSLSGRYVQHPFAFKVEAAIQLLPNMTVNFVRTQSVLSWRRNTQAELPSVSGHRQSGVRYAQSEAIEAAAFGFEMARDPKYLKDGRSDRA